MQTKKNTTRYVCSPSSSNYGTRYSCLRFLFCVRCYQYKTLGVRVTVHAVITVSIYVGGVQSTASVVSVCSLLPAFFVFMGVGEQTPMASSRNWPHGSGFTSKWFFSMYPALYATPPPVSRDNFQRYPSPPPSQHIFFNLEDNLWDGASQKTIDTHRACERDKENYTES